MTTVTASAISRLLANRSEYRPSKQVRGYGTWTSGYTVSQYGDSAIIEWTVGSTARRRMTTDQATETQRQRLAEAKVLLQSTGYATIIEVNCYGILSLIVTK